MNIFDKSYQLVDEFVSKNENNRLISGTGSYSSLFRGSLFGETKTKEVVDALKTKQIKVLWLGSNPNVPESLKLIQENNSQSHYQDFLIQKKCGYFSEVSYNSETNIYQSGWDPINNPDHKWSFYTEIFNKIYGSESTLMANFLPWGSEDYQKFLKGIGNIDNSLLSRLLEFSRKLNLLLIEELKPELIVVPKSIVNTPIKNWHFGADKDNLGISKRIDAKVPFIFTLKELSFSYGAVKVLICPHPSYTPRVGKENREDIQNEIINMLTKKST